MSDAASCVEQTSEGGFSGGAPAASIHSEARDHARLSLEGNLMSMLDWLSTTNWTAFGPAPIDTPTVGLGLGAGRIEAAAPHPVSPDVMYVAGSAGGVWKTGVWNSNAPVWLALGDAEESLSVGGYHPLVVHPANHNLILAAVSGHGAGVLKSTNGGLTWKLLGSTIFEGATIGSIAVDQADTDIVHVSVSGGASGGGVYKSIDGGDTWINTTSSVHAGNVTDVILSRFTPHMLYAGMVATWYKAGAATAGVYKSENGGASWDLLPGLPSGSGLADAVRLESGSKQGVVYVTCFVRHHGKTFVKRAKTTDNGAKWNALAKIPGGAELRPWHLLFGVDPSDDNHVFANGAYALFESIDSGKTWARADVNGGNPIGDDWVNIAFQPKGKVVVTADRNVYRYDPQKKTWQSKEGNLQVTQFYDITLDPNDSDIAYGVAQDHSAAMKFTGSVEWAYMAGAGGETGKVLVDPTDTKRLYVSNPLSAEAFVARSGDGGQSWEVILQASDFSSGDYPLAYSVQRSFAIDQKDPNRLLIGTTKVWQTKDATAAEPEWKPISDVLGPADNVALQYVTALAIAPSHPKTIYAATADGHVWITTNGGKKWKAHDSGLFGAGAGTIVDIRVDPQHSNRIVAAGNAVGSVWYFNAVRGPAQWRNVAGDLQTHLWPTAIYADWSFATPAFYLGTSRGVYHSVNLGVHWSVFGDGLPKTGVSDLEAAKSGIIAASTIGRGAWAIRTLASKLAGRIDAGAAGPGFVSPGDPVEGVTLMLDGGGGPPREMPTAVTDARGRYSFDNVPPGTYTVRRVAPAGFVAAEGAAERITVHGSDIRDLDFHYHSAPDLVRAGAAYSWIADLNALPGRRPGQPVGGRRARERR